MHFSAADLLRHAEHVLLLLENSFFFPFISEVAVTENSYNEQTIRRSPEALHKYFSCLISYSPLQERWELVQPEGGEVTAAGEPPNGQMNIMTEPCGTIKGKELEYGRLATDLAPISEVSLHLATCPRWQQTEGGGASSAVPAARKSAVQTLSGVTDCCGGSRSQ